MMAYANYTSLCHIIEENGLHVFIMNFDIQHFWNVHDLLFVQWPNHNNLMIVTICPHYSSRYLVSFVSLPPSSPWSCIDHLLSMNRSPICPLWTSTSREKLCIAQILNQIHQYNHTFPRKTLSSLQSCNYSILYKRPLAQASWCPCKHIHCGWRNCSQTSPYKLGANLFLLNPSRLDRSHWCYF